MSNTGFALPVRPGFRKIDLLIFAGVLASLYALVSLARNWLGPFTPQVHIDRSPAALPLYAAY